MSTFNPTETACGKVRSLLDSYVGGEPVEEVRRHLKACPACNALAEEHERVRALVRRAVRNEPAPESLRGRIQEMVRREAR